MKRISLLNFLAIMVAVMTSAQSAEWIVRPGQYTSLTPFCKGMLKVSDGERWGLLNQQGQTAVPMEYDQITDFFDGYAFILKRSEGKVRLCAFVTQQGELTMLSDVFYIVPGMVFFSEGLMPVKNRADRIGFINKSGQLAIRCNYDWVLPFSEGYACTEKGRELDFINASGRGLTFMLPNGGEPSEGCSFWNGYAYVSDEDGGWFRIDQNGRCEKVDKSRVKNQPRDYLGRVGTGKPENVAYQPMTLSSEPDSEIKAYRENGLVGYRSANQVVLPCQFEEGSEFTNHAALVKVKGTYGLLRLVSGSSAFDVQAVSPRHYYANSEAQQCVFRVSSPAQSSNLSVKVFDGGRAVMPNQLNHQDYAIMVTPLEGSKTYDLQLESDDIVLWAGNVSYSFSKASPLTASLSVSGSEADANGHIAVIGTVHNPNTIPITTTIRMEGSDALHEVSPIDVTIPAKGSKSLSSYFTVKSQLAGQWVSVETDDGASSRRDNLHLRPYVPRSAVSVTVVVNSQDADANNHVNVTAIIKNPNQNSVTTTVTMKGSGTFAAKTVTITIPAGGNQSVSSFFTVTKAMPNQWVEVTTSGGGSARKTGLHFIPN